MFKKLLMVFIVVCILSHMAISFIDNDKGDDPYPTGNNITICKIYHA